MESFYESYQATAHFSMDPVFDSVAALYRFPNESAEVRQEISDSVVILDFEEFAWFLSKTKSAQMKDYWKETRKFSKRNLTITKTCLQCGKSYNPPFGTEKRSKLCSIQCRALWNKG